MCQFGKVVAVVGWDLLSADYMSAARLFFVPSFSPLLTTPLSFRRKKNPHVLSSPLLLCAQRDGAWIKEEEEERKKCQLTWNFLCAEGAQVKFFVTAGGAKIQF